MRLSLLSSPALASALALTLAGCAASPPPPAASPAPPPSAPAVDIPATPPPKPVTASVDASLGELDFPVTGSDECQRHFREGMLALHSFLYDQAHVAFAAALAEGPRCAMASWGDAMAYSHAVWRERDLTKGRAALTAVTPAGEEALTPKERAYLKAARALFAKDDSEPAMKAWLAAAEGMHHDYPDDDEVALQHALAILAVYGYDSAHVREQMEAGSIALQILARKPNHPGAAHYAIHAFDSREHAILALPAARTYARIAPSASHALHMPSHTFVHLGMWRDVVPSNERAYAASVAWETSRGHSAGEYDWHSYSWLVAAHLELGQPAAARKLIDDAAGLLASARPNDDTAELRDGYEVMVGNYVSQTGKWAEVEAMVAPVFTPTSDEGGPTHQVACAAHAPGGPAMTRGPSVLASRLWANVLRAEAAIRAGDEATVVKRVADMKAVRAQMAPWKKTLGDKFAARWEARESLLLLRAHGGKKPSSDVQKKVIAALEDRLREEIGQGTSGPAMEETTHEELADALIAAGKPKDALVQLEKDLEERPNRAIALLGAARAAKASGDTAKARARYGELAEQWKGAEGDLPALTEVKEGAK